MANWCAVCHKIDRIHCCDRPNLTKLAAVARFGLELLQGGNFLLKTFLIGVLLGLGCSAAALYLIPAVDQYRENSIVSVELNGGNSESFHINIPTDRIMAGAAGQSSGQPAGVDWPEDEIFAGVSADIFKVRNKRDVVIGIAARTAAKESDFDSIDWIVHLPARGSLFVSMDPSQQEGGHRQGRLRTGSQEFETLTGTVEQRWVPDLSGEEDAPAGRIELLAIYESTAESGK